MFTQQQLDVIKNEAQMRARTWLTTFQNAYYARPANMPGMMEMPDGNAPQWPPVPGRPEEAEITKELGDETAKD